MIYARRLIELLELDLDRCENRYGVNDGVASFCTAGIEHAGTAQAGAAATITLAADASAADDAYNGMVVVIVGGTGAGQERRIVDYDGTLKLATVDRGWDTEPDSTSEYAVIDRAGACYNTRRTCQDPDNYVRGSYTYRFTRRGTPAPVGATVRPYIESIEQAPTELDPEKGLAVRSSLRVAMVDAPDSDTEQDPYIETRQKPAGSTWWRRLIARNLATAGRTARVKRLYVEPGASYSIDDPSWQTERYIIEAINGPDRNGNIALSLKDPLKLTDRVKLPQPTAGELLAPITAADTSLTLKEGHGDQYPASGYIAIGSGASAEVIQYTSRTGDTLSWPDASYRGKFGTVAAEHNANERVQLCQVWQGATVAQVLKDLLNAAGIDDSEIDLAGFAEHQDIWFGTYSITVCLPEPETIADLLKELCITTQSVIWWQPNEQKVKWQPLRPLSPMQAAPALLTDEASFIDASIEVLRQEQLRLNDVTVWYAPYNATEKKDEQKNYQRAVRVVDLDARSQNEYGDVRQKVFYARFLDISSDQAAAECAVRMLNFRRDAPIEIRARLDPKDSDDVALGAQLDVETDGLVDFDGALERQRVIVTRRVDRGKEIEVSLLVTFLNRRYAWIAPDDHPDYGTATDEQRRYGYISDDDGKLEDGSDGHVIV